MPENKYAFSLPKRQEQFSFAYIKAIASVAGYKVVQADAIDEDSLDVLIDQKGSSNKEEYPYHPSLRVQLKCTYTAKTNDDGFLTYRLSAKNYNDLRAETGMPFILAVLCIPSEDELEWLIETSECMTLYNVAYWLSLRGKPALKPSSTEFKNRTKTVHIPASQRLNVDGLTAIMDALAEGRFPE